MTILHIDDSRPTVVTFKCDTCQSVFIRSGARKNNPGPRLDSRILKHKKHYCCLRCAYDGRERNDLSLNCDLCGKEIKKMRCLIKETNFCSRECYWKYKKIDPRVVGKKGRPCSEETKKKLSKIHKGLQAGEKHPLYGRHHTQETKDKIATKAKERFQKDQTKNPMYGRKHTKEAKEKISATRTKKWINGEYKDSYATGHYISTKTGKKMFYKSSWEKVCMEWLDNNNDIITYEYENLRMPYFVQGKTQLHKRYYIPDFFVTFQDGSRELWEIKPIQLTKTKTALLKAEAAITYCKENGIDSYRVLTKEDLQNRKML